MIDREPACEQSCWLPHQPQPRDLSDWTTTAIGSNGKAKPPDLPLALFLSALQYSYNVFNMCLKKNICILLGKTGNLKFCVFVVQIMYGLKLLTSLPIFQNIEKVQK
jgi:hypothetical protein